MLLVDIALAVAAAILVLILAPGLAIVAILALAVLLVCAVSFAIAGWRGRRTVGRRGSRASRRPAGRP